jgi:hypothetical protein
VSHSGTGYVRNITSGERMRYIFALLFLTLALGGCSPIRGAAMLPLVIVNTPLPHDGVRDQLQVAPFVMLADPMGYTKITSPARPDEMLTFYRRELAKLGWEETADSHARGISDQSYQNEFDFMRTLSLGKGPGAWEIMHEKMELRISDLRHVGDQSRSLTEATLTFSTHYPWDQPATWLAELLQKPGGSWAWGSLIVTVCF